MNHSLSTFIVAFACLVTLACHPGLENVARGAEPRAPTSCERAWVWAPPKDALQPATPHDRPGVERARADMDMITLASYRFCAAAGHLPETLSELVAFGVRQPRGDLCVLREAPVDPWGRTYEFRRERSTIHVRSAGPDHRFSTPDDQAPPLPNSLNAVEVDIHVGCRVAARASQVRHSVRDSLSRMATASKP